jgi:hypothetical protein
VLVQEGIADQYVEKVKQAMANAEKKMGDPTDPKTAYGPLADKKQFDRVMGFLQGAREEGVQVLVGGERQGDKGTFVKPTVFLNPDLKSKVYTDEIFGPVISVRTFKDEEEAIKLANDTTYGLGCKCCLNNSIDAYLYSLCFLQQPYIPVTSPVRCESLVRSKLEPLASTPLLTPPRKHHSVDSSRVALAVRAGRKASRNTCNPRQFTST